MDSYQDSPLWKQAFASQNDGFNAQRQILSNAFTEFRNRVSLLVAQIHKDMPSLTVHDITHIDALWWTASETAGPSYPLNPAEAFVLGGAFLLHDSAHCIAAYPGGIDELRALPEWTTNCAKFRILDEDLVKGTEQFQLVLFEVLRNMHPKQARVLAKVHWTAPGDNSPLFLLPHDELRRAYSDVIGQIAESHWSSPHQLEPLNHSKITTPACLHPAPWTVDILKLAILLRTADAAHIDAQRAPRFLQALVQPEGVSLVHWNFQARINKIKIDPDPARKELCISGSAFPVEEQDAWWMAYDTARMIDNELKAADRLLLDLHRPQLAARSVAFSFSPEAFSRNVPTDGWHPVDTSIKITDIKTMVDRFGGEKLYGSEPSSALKEILQNAVDAIHACRKLGGLGEEEGEIDINCSKIGEDFWLQITDTGIGMSRYVLTEVLLDFGRSLWRSGDLRGEWKGLLATDFEAIGQFGIGFFSIFMLGQRVRIVTRRYETKETESAHWLLEFSAGTERRPTLRAPDETERLKRHGTQVSVLITKPMLDNLLRGTRNYYSDRSVLTLEEVCGQLAPALDINLYVKPPDSTRQRIIKANDWKTLDQHKLLLRINPLNDTKNFGKADIQLTDIIDENDGMIGRLAIERYPAYYRGERGIGIVNGLLAGVLRGIEGVILAKPQVDLARKTAAPKLSLNLLQKWANKQLEIYCQRGIIPVDTSSLLAGFGADPKKLTLGYLAGDVISYHDLYEFALSNNSITIHLGEVSHDDDDDIIYKEFDHLFERSANLLEISDVSKAQWVTLIEPLNQANSEWSILSIIENLLNEVWGDPEIIEDIMTEVGTINTRPISRDCRTIKRKVS